MYYKTSESAVTKLSQAIHEGDGEIIRTPFFGDVSKLPVRYEIWALEPGGSEGRHVHDGQSALEEFYYFIEGEGLMWADGEDIPMTAGDAVLAPEGSDHGFRNTGSEPLKLLIIWGKPMG
jgi:mannose-6-phosphate isomerase-like protein (cupin superfamily)